MKIKNILVSQPEPETQKSPYYDLAKKYNLDVEFRPFITIEGVSVKEFRQFRIEISEFTALIFSSRHAIDHFFRICGELKIEMPENTKYFCISESIAFYLQKYIVYRKRKVFQGNNSFDGLIDIIKKYPQEKFLVPVSDVHKDDIPALLEKYKLNYTKAIMYRTVNSDMKSLGELKHDILVFFSPSGIKSLFENFPNFVQGEKIIAAFGPTTAKAAIDAGLRLDIQAPNPEATSMPAALDIFIKNHIKNCK